MICGVNTSGRSEISGREDVALKEGNDGPPQARHNHMAIKDQYGHRDASLSVETAPTISMLLAQSSAACERLERMANRRDTDPSNSDIRLYGRIGRGELRTSKYETHPRNVHHGASSTGTDMYDEGFIPLD